MKRTDFEEAYKVCPVCEAPIERAKLSNLYSCSIKPPHFGYYVSGEEISYYGIYFDKYVSITYKHGKITLTKKESSGPNKRLVMPCDDPAVWLKDPKSLFDRFEKLLLLS